LLEKIETTREKSLKNALKTFLPERLAAFLSEGYDHKVKQLSKKDLEKILHKIKALPIPKARLCLGNIPKKI